MYRVIPALLTRMVPKLLDWAVFTVAAAATVVPGEAAPEFDAGAVVVALLGLDDPHAARKRPTTASDATAVPGRARRAKGVGASRARRPNAVASSSWLVMMMLP